MSGGAFGSRRACPGEASRRRRTAAYGKTVWFWHPLLVSSWRRISRPDRVSAILQSVSDGDKTNSSPGRARYKPSNHCAGNAGLLRLYLYARVRFCAQFCTRDRGCSKHPAFPAPSYFWADDFGKTSGAARREMAELYSVGATSLRAKRRNPFLSLRFDGLLRGACHRARIRATRWLAMTVHNSMILAV
jgi:hypothetical protein